MWMDFLLLYGLSVYPVSCPDTSRLEALVEHGGIYIGEIHGTNEAPALVACLLSKVIKDKRNVVLSLELPRTARDRHDEFWAQTQSDGRSSVAMRRLLDYAILMENAGLVRIHYQNQDNTVNYRDFDKSVGEYLKEASINNLVIALSGNIHAARALPERMQMLPKPAGSYVGSHFSNVMLANINKGEAWLCVGMGECGAREVGGARESHAPGDLVKVFGSIAGLGYDYVFYLESYSASPPLLKN